MRLHAVPGDAHAAEEGRVALDISVGGGLLDVRLLDADDLRAHAVVAVQDGLAVPEGLEAEAAGAVAVAEEGFVAHCDSCVGSCGLVCVVVGGKGVVM